MITGSINQKKSLNGNLDTVAGSVTQKKNLTGSLEQIGTFDHNELYNRELEDQHPIKAITGLEELVVDSMHFKGALDTTILPDPNEYNKGDVIILKPLKKEYILVEEGDPVIKKWFELGDELSYVTKDTKIIAGDGLIGGGDLSENRTISHTIGQAPNKPEGFYKISTDGHSHISGVTVVGQTDIKNLGFYINSEVDTAIIGKVNEEKTRAESVEIGLGNRITSLENTQVIGVRLNNVEIRPGPDKIINLGSIATTEALSAEVQRATQAEVALGLRIDNKQDTLTAGQNISILNNVISAKDDAFIDVEAWDSSISNIIQRKKGTTTFVGRYNLTSEKISQGWHLTNQGLTKDNIEYISYNDIGIYWKTKYKEWFVDNDSGSLVRYNDLVTDTIKATYIDDYQNNQYYYELKYAKDGILRDIITKDIKLTSTEIEIEEENN